MPNCVPNYDNLTVVSMYQIIQDVHFETQADLTMLDIYKTVPIVIISV